MQPLAILQLLLLVGAANVAPLVAKGLLGSFAAWPVDLGQRFLGQPLFGRSKTWRGLIAAVSAAALLAPILGYSWTLGAWVGAAAMLGDLTSSFIKRRLRMKPSSQAIGLDQIPEVLFPALACQHALHLGDVDIAVAVLVFLVLELSLSKLLHRVGLRDRPY